ncbi:hypothetical protein N665_0218s0045 [Sinapis alba]|nr:hypothetical protein N665_0218s0045 [Sinapis alba]
MKIGESPGEFSGTAFFLHGLEEMKPRVDHVFIMHFIIIFKLWASFGLKCIMSMFVILPVGLLFNENEMFTNPV